MKYFDHELERCCGRVLDNVITLTGFWLAGQQSGSASDVSAVRKTKQMELRMVSVQNRLFYLVTSSRHHHCVKIIKSLINYTFRRYLTSRVSYVWDGSELPSSRVYCYVTWSVQTAQPPPCYCSPVLMLCTVKISVRTNTHNVAGCSVAALNVVTFS